MSQNVVNKDKYKQENPTRSSRRMRSKALIRMKTHKEARALCQDSKADPPRGKTTDIPYKRDERAKTQL